MLRRSRESPPRQLTAAKSCWRAPWLLLFLDWGKKQKPISRACLGDEGDLWLARRGVRLAASLCQDADRLDPEPLAAATSRSCSATVPRRRAIGFLRRLAFRLDPLGKHVRTSVDLLEVPGDRGGPVADSPRSRWVCSNGV